MDTIECGSASGSLRVDNDGVGTAFFSGLMVPSNFLAMSVLTMRAGSVRGAKGLLYRNDQAAICCDPASMTAAYPMLAPALRALPVAFMVNDGQAGLYEHVVRRAGAAGLIRRAFYSEAERANGRRHDRYVGRQPRLVGAAPLSKHAGAHTAPRPTLPQHLAVPEAARPCPAI